MGERARERGYFNVHGNTYTVPIFTPLLRHAALVVIAFGTLIVAAFVLPNMLSRLRPLEWQAPHGSSVVFSIQGTPMAFVDVPSWESFRREAEGHLDSQYPVAASALTKEFRSFFGENLSPAYDLAPLLDRGMHLEVTLQQGHPRLILTMKSSLEPSEVETMIGHLHALVRTRAPEPEVRRGEILGFLREDVHMPTMRGTTGKSMEGAWTVKATRMPSSPRLFVSAQQNSTVMLATDTGSLLFALHGGTGATIALETDVSEDGFAFVMPEALHLLPEPLASLAGESCPLCMTGSGQVLFFFAPGLSSR